MHGHAFIAEGIGSGIQFCIYPLFTYSTIFFGLYLHASESIMGTAGFLTMFSITDELYLSFFNNSLPISTCSHRGYRVKKHVFF